MILKMNRKSRGSKGVVEYLLNEREKEGTAHTLRGNPEITKSLIQTIDRKHKYLSGGLMFAEEEHLNEVQKNEIMDAFQEVLFTGLNSNQYHVLWVEHIDKGRLELNFVIPRIELYTGNDLDLYSHRRDLPLFDMWKNGINKHYGLSDPNDPNRARTISERTKSARVSGTIVANRKTLDETLHQLVSKGHIKNRKQILELLEQSGYQITRCNNESMSVKHNDIGTKALRLKGGIYSESFTSIGSIEEISRVREQGTREYNYPTPQGEVKEHRRVYQSYLQTRTKRHQKRYKRSPNLNKKESRVIKGRDTNYLDSTLNTSNQRILIDDGIRKLIETGNTKRAESIKRLGESEGELLEQIKVSNNRLSDSLREPEQKLSQSIANTRNNLERNINKSAQYIDGKIAKTNSNDGTNATRIHRLFRAVYEEFSKLRKSIKGVIDEIKVLKIFEKAKQEMCTDAPTIKLKPRR